MKKLNIFLLGVLGLTVCSCQESIEPAPPQQNEQQPIVTIDDIASQKAGVLAASSVTLEDYRAEGAVVPVMELVSTKDLPAGSEVEYRLELSSTENFNKVVTLHTIAGTPNDNGSVVYSVDAAEWNAAHLALFGKSPKVKTAYYRVPMYLDMDGSDYRIAPEGVADPASYYVESGSLQETCMDSGFVIEDHYYFLSNSTTWDIANREEVEKYAFEHSEDVSVYDDPVFVFKFKVNQEEIDANGGGSWWKIAPESAINAQNWDAMVGTETNGDESLTGLLVTEHAESGKLTEPGNYKLTINMEDMSYKFELLLQPEVLYTPGGSNGWNQLNSSWLQLKPGDYYYGLVPVDGSFKVCAEPKWDNATDYGAATEDPSNAGNLVLGGTAKNITPEESGLYWMHIDYDHVSYELTTYTLTKIETVGLIGSFAGSGWDSDVVMASADGGITWTVDVTFAAGDEFKIRFNSDWGMNFGGDSSDLTHDGANIKVDEAGDYTVTLTVQPGLPHLSLTKK